MAVSFGMSGWAAACFVAYPQKSSKATGAYRNRVYRFVPPSARALTPPSARGLRPQVPVDNPLYTFGFGDNSGVGGAFACDSWSASGSVIPRGEIVLSDQRKRVGRKKKAAGTFEAAGQGVLVLPKQQTVIRSRLIETAGQLVDPGEDIAYQHSILCQTGLPYRDPGADMREWGRAQGNASLLIEAGKAWDADRGEWVKLGLPWGPKARLVLLHLNSEAIRSQSPVIDVGDSLTAFVKRLGLDTGGRTVRAIKDQVGALSGAMIRMAFAGEKGAFQIDAKVVSGFDLWFPKDDRQRVLWPSVVHLSGDYFESLQRHAVPLDERAIAALSHSAMALDVYAWLAQRLHRIPKPHRQFIPWPILKEQFGPDFERLRKFREKFMEALRQAHVVYPAAKIDVTGQGLFLYTSPPPIAKTGVLICLPKG